MLKPLSFIFLFWLLVFSINAQTPISEQVSNEVSAVTKEKISERIKLYYKYKENGQWDKVFDLLLKPQSVTKQEYVKEHTNPLDKLKYLSLKFQPISFIWSDFSPNEVWIDGCNIEQEEGKNLRKRNEIVVATLKNEEWYFSGWGDVDQSESWCK